VVSPGGYHAGVADVAETGPPNTHFFRDVALAFVVSALTLSAGAGLRDWRQLRRRHAAQATKSLRA